MGGGRFGFPSVAVGPGAPVTDVHLLTFQLPGEVFVQRPERDGCIFKYVSGVQF